MNKAIFLNTDLSGVRNISYNVDVNLLKLTMGAGGALRHLQYAGYKQFIISNQSGIARGYFTEKTFIQYVDHLSNLFAREGVIITGYYYSPHAYRKPRPGLLKKAAKDYYLDLNSSWVVADVLDDIETGNRSGCKTIFMKPGKEIEWNMTKKRMPHFTAQTFQEVEEIILSSNGFYSMPFM